MRLFLSTIATSGASASAEVSAFLPEEGKIPDLSQWRRCDAFREASNEKTDSGKLRHILQASYSVAGLPYAMAVRQMAELCPFPRESTEFFDEFIKQTLEPELPNIRESFRKHGKKSVAALIPQDGLGPPEDMSDAVGEIFRIIISEDMDENEKIASIIKVAKARADRAIKSLNLDENPVTPLTEPISSEETRDAIELQVRPFDFNEFESNLCEQLAQDGHTPATYLQSVLQTYGLGYALLLGNRLDHCAQDKTTSLVKKLHNDLYRWVSVYQPANSGTLNRKIFEDLKLPQPSTRQERDWLAHPSTIGLADLIERVAIEQILSPVERNK